MLYLCGRTFARYQAVERLLNALAKHDAGATVQSLAHCVLALLPVAPNIR